MSVDFKEAQKIVKKLFPDSNFFAFKIFDNEQDSYKMNQEIKEIQKINEEAEKHWNRTTKSKICINLYLEK